MAKYSKDKYKQYIAKGQMEQLIEELLQDLSQYPKTSSLQKTYDALILLSGQWKGIQQGLDLNIADPKASKIEKNRIRQSLLHLINNLPNHYFAFLNGDKKATPKASPDLRQQVEAVHQSSNFEYDLFLSFSSEDLAEAKRVSEELRGYGLSVFLSDEALKADTGKSFFEKIDYALHHSQHFVLLSSPRAMASEWVKIEYETFLTEYYIKSKRKRRLIILKSKAFDLETVPRLLRSLQFANEVRDILATFVKDKVFQDRQKKREEQVLEEKRKQEATRQLRLLEEQRQAELKALQQKALEEKRRREAAKQKQANLSPILVDLEKNMLDIPAGTFMMGCTSEQGDDCYGDEKPAHQVTLSSYKINRYQVTQEEWRAVMDNNPSHFKGCDKCPVEKVSWNDIQDFLKKLNQLTGKNYRLPTEAEWEYAARGGENYKYAGSNTIGKVAWYDDNSESKTHPVGKKQANGYGLYDMSGNVWEWCQDWYGAYSSKAQSNPKGADSGSGRVLRGGGWSFSARLCRVADRADFNPGSRFNNSGFRLAHR